MSPGPCCGPAEAEPCRACVGPAEVATEAAEDWGSPDTWPGWTDDGVIGDGSRPTGPTLTLGGLLGLDDGRDGLSLTLAELVGPQIAGYRAWQTDAGDLLAEALTGLLAEIEITKARTPGQLRDRRAALGRGAPPETCPGAHERAGRER